MGSGEGVLPRYGADWLGEVVPSAVAALGVPGWSNVLQLPPMDSCVVFLIDGLGWNLLHRYADEAPYLSTLAEGTSPITCGVPSTTATSLTSLGTGLPPGAHGVVGFTSRIPGTDRLLDALRWDSRVDPHEWQAHKTAFARARAAGVAAHVVSKRAFEGSGLTEASQRGAVFVGADTVGERISATVRAAAHPSSLTYVYEGELDTTGHRRGTTSWAWRHQLAMVDTFAARLREALPDRTALVVTADHGMVDVEMEDRLDVDEEPELLSGVSLFGGEARFRHLYCDNGAVEDVAFSWRERMGADAWVATRDEAIDEGWFGSVDTQVRPRLGDVMVASLGDMAVVSSSHFPREMSLVGLHGSLTADEMLVPLL
ncbi:MAG: alkaline phosphatase family protein, partial [Nocardioidaceae bacterium]|nr:alkaline phosphatase family protein [Nocardioidaceae bacterium]